MKKITAEDPESKSADIVTENIERLKELFPESVTERRIDFAVLKELLGGEIDDREEKYGLNWHGKRRARRLALTPSTGTLLPCPDESVDWDTTQNLIIEGDNLEVLKLLQKSYARRVKLIYIDPPYNTGKDFIYKDDYHDSLRNYLMLTGQIDSDGRTISSNTESSGRFHTDWLNMMYPRLRLARGLLRDDGAIFVSINDHEFHDLRLLMNEVFGEENFVATIIWHKMDGPKNTAIHFSEDHDYIVVFAKNGERWRPKDLERSPEMVARYKNPDNDPRGPWLLSDLAARNYYAQGKYPITTKTGRLIPGPPAGSYWRVSKERFDALDRDGRIWWGDSGNNRPGIKRFLSEVRQGVVPQTYWPWKEVGSTRNAKQELSQLLGARSGEELFITPKPTRLIERIVQLGTKPDDDEIVLDFVAGSGTTGHAVFLSNARDQGRRRFILVQLPEPTNDPNVATIAELTKQRVRLAGVKMKSENPMFSGDVGFRIFKLASSNITTWEPDRDHFTESLQAATASLRPARSESDILYELFLKLNLDLCVPIEKRELSGKDVHAVGGGVLMACLTTSITAADAEPLALGIVEWHRDLAPAGETTFVFRDSAFENDVAKSNVAAILGQHGLANVKSL